MSRPTTPPARFDRAYIERAYRDYRKQNPPRKLAFYRALAEAAAPARARPRVLDVGCAFGLFLAALGPGWERYGIDASEYALDEARRNVPEAQLAPAGSGALAFPGPFDVITAFDVLEHVSSLEALVASITGALARDGSFVFVVPVYDGPTGPLVRALDRDRTHVHKESRSFWLDLAPAELEAVDWWGIYRYLLPGGYYVHRVTRRLRRYAPAIACQMRRKR